MVTGRMRRIVESWRFLQDLIFALVFLINLYEFCCERRNLVIRFPLTGVVSRADDNFLAFKPDRRYGPITLLPLGEEIHHKLLVRLRHGHHASTVVRLRCLVAVRYPRGNVEHFIRKLSV